MALHGEKAANRLEVEKRLLIFLQVLIFLKKSFVCVSVYQEGAECLILLQLFLA